MATRAVTSPANDSALAKTRQRHRFGFRSWKQSRVLGTWIDDLTIPEILDRLDEGTLFTINPDHFWHLRRNPDFVAAYRSATYVSCDSMWVLWTLAALGRRVRERGAGSDMMPAYCARHAANPDVKMFLLGAQDGVAETARQNLNELHGREIVVDALGPSMNFVNDEAEIDAAIARVNASGATTLVIGLGAPKQEIWINRHRHRMPGVKVFMALGAALDFEAHNLKRAPRFMRMVGLEWLFRLAMEPRRLWWRYVRQIEFFWFAMLDGLGFYRAPATSPAKD
ncbi:WecB/TagA/CpsF family glycosyltransferase [Sphingomonas sp. ID0503]|uniref:WecB/TagA/CpsF family glycosyltransferase n=1 Tax=Sphingomonas sp. ID0503 TaxID=3399691 RepID=UPI003AFA2509